MNGADDFVELIASDSLVNSRYGTPDLIVLVVRRVREIIVWLDGQFCQFIRPCSYYI
jgi:hypothetical protein